MFQAILLGLVQGLTEFLPVSSSGHLVVVPYLLGWPSPGLAFDVALHAGTLVAVVGYFFGDVWYLATRSVGVGIVAEGEAARARRTVALLAVGTAPAALAGYFLEDFFASTFENPRLVSFFLLVTSVILYGAETLRRSRARAAVGAGAGSADLDAIDVGRDETTVGWRDSLLIGVAQALAIFPGISRAGSTIAAGMVQGLSRQAATRFSFLLSIPVIAGATTFQLTEMVTGDATTRFTWPQVVAGMAVAAVSGLWAIRFLLRLVQSDDLTGFARYVALLGVLVFVGTLWLGPPSEI